MSRPLPALTGNDHPLAFVVLAHGEWSTLVDLVDVLAADPHDTVVIHLDRKIDWRKRQAIAKRFDRRGNVIVFSAVRCKWGGISLIDATLQALHRLKLSGRRFQYASLLSGVDYPLKPLSELRGFLSAHEGAEFIEAKNFYTERWIRTGIYAERFEYWFPFARSGLLSRPFKVWYHLVKLLDFRRLTLTGFVGYSGSQWWTLSRDAVAWILTNPASADLRHRMKFTFVSDEMYFQTLVMSSPFADEVAYHNLRHIEWLPRGTPYSFQLGDFDRLASSPQFFCRKVIKRQNPDLVERMRMDLLTAPPTPHDGVTDSIGARQAEETIP